GSARWRGLGGAATPWANRRARGIPGDARRRTGRAGHRATRRPHVTSPRGIGPFARARLGHARPRPTWIRRGARPPAVAIDTRSTWWSPQGERRCLPRWG